MNETWEGKALQDLGKKIAALRKEKELSYRQLSLEIDLSVSYLVKLESGVSNPSYTTLLKLADYFGVKLSDFEFSMKS